MANRKLKLTLDVHAAKLRPNLGEGTNHGTVDHLRSEEIQVGDVGVAALKLAHVLDVLQLIGDKGVVRVTLAMNEAENVAGFLPAVFACKPARRLRERDHENEKKSSGEHLETPRKTPSSCAVVIGLVVANERGAVGNVEHDENAPGNGPLLEANEATTFGRWRKLSNVDGDLSRFNTDRETVDDTANDEHANVDGTSADSRTNDPKSDLRLVMRSFSTFATKTVY